MCISLTCNSPESSSAYRRFPAAVEEGVALALCRRLPRIRSGRTAMNQTAMGKRYGVNIKEGHWMGSMLWRKFSYKVKACSRSVNSKTSPFPVKSCLLRGKHWSEGSLVAIVEDLKGHGGTKCWSNKTFAFQLKASLRYECFMIHLIHRLSIELSINWGWLVGLAIGFLLVSSFDLLMDAKPIIVGLEALRAYHSIDRALFAILATVLCRDPLESLQIIALWLWLEQVGFGKVTRKILASAPLFINQTAEEAIMCLKCIKDSSFIYSAEATDIPMTRCIIEKDISLWFFNENRVTALHEVGTIINEDCLPAMQDVIRQAHNGYTGESSSRSRILNPLNAAQSSSSNPTLMPFNGGRSSLSNEWLPSNASRRSLPNPIGPLNGGRNSGHNQMRIPANATNEESSLRNQVMIPENAARRSLSNPILMPSNAGQSSSNAGQSSSNPNVIPFSGRQRLESNHMRMSHHSDESMIRNFSSMRIGRNAFGGNNQVINELPPEDRTMFVTFSRGYPVAEAEVRHFFTTVFGNCIESFYMQEVGPYEQPLYALVVFHKASFIEEILDGTEKVKFSIYGKHVWMRKYVPRNSSSS
ncbi:unnamed protein product [Fraxinus pennsylvanica]|uniref:Uncharacterized protein n=1 Tax=Fraxinus pennsylvanica TaxID=56036 RepID=A0AAD1ZDH1_9LAMI|nr:unnamed protein product [Fraxinus pennsylvanica]